jgi:hypothetical protein
MGRIWFALLVTLLPVSAFGQANGKLQTDHIGCAAQVFQTFPLVKAA